MFSSAPTGVLAQTEALTAEQLRLIDACGEKPGAACEWVYDRTGSARWAEVGSWVVDKPLRILLIWLVAWILAKVTRRMIRRFAAKIAGSASSGRLKRARERTPSILLTAEQPSLRSAARSATIAQVLRGVSTAIIYIFAGVYTLEVIGLNLGPLIAGAGVVGVALGFGAQSLVRDFLAGIFILLEDQYGVGDIVDLGEAVGTVEQVNLRTTRLRDVNGTVWHVPNGEILRVGNSSQQWARALLDVVVAHGTDADSALALLKEVADRVVAGDELAPDVLEEAEVWGVEDLTPIGITLRLVVKTRPGSQWKVMRALRLAIPEALHRAGIAMPPGAGPAVTTTSTTGTKSGR